MTTPVQSGPVESTDPLPVVDLVAAEHVRVNAVARWAAVDTPAVIRARQKWLADAAYPPLEVPRVDR